MFDHAPTEAPEVLRVQIAALIRDGFAHEEIGLVMPSATPKLIAATAAFYGIEITAKRRFREDMRMTARILAATNNRRTAGQVAELAGCSVACVLTRAKPYALPLPVRISKNAA